MLSKAQTLVTRGRSPGGGCLLRFN